MDASCRGCPSRHVVVSLSRSSLTPAEPFQVRKLVIAALWRLSSEMRWGLQSLGAETRNAAPSTNATKDIDLSLALIGDRVQGGVTGLIRVHDMWDAPMRRGCGRSDGYAQVILKRHHLPTNTFALVVIAEQGTPRRATGRQAGARNPRRPFVRALRTTERHEHVG